MAKKYYCPVCGYESDEPIEKCPICGAAMKVRVLFRSLLCRHTSQIEHQAHIADSIGKQVVVQNQRIPRVVNRIVQGTGLSADVLP